MDPHGGSMQGGLESVPGSWFQQLLSKLSCKDSLTLFRTSRRVCAQVVQSTRSVTLRLKPLMQWGQTEEEDKSKVAARQRVITCLLEGCVNLKVVVHRDIRQPFPTALSGVVTELTVQMGRNSRVNDHAGFTWHELQQLHTLTFRQSASAEDVRLLCEALEAGQLPCLRTLTWWPYDSKYYMHQVGIDERSKLVPHLLQRLACAAGKHVVNLTASDELLIHVSHFSVLKSVTLLRNGISVEALHQLYACPTLKHVTFSSESDEYDCWHIGVTPYFHGSISNANCTWETLSLINVSPERVEALCGLGGLKELRFVHVMTRFYKQDCALVIRLLNMGVKVVCVPHAVHGKGTFHLRGLCAEHMLLLLCLQDVHTLHLEIMSDGCLALLPAVYAGVNKAVSCIVLERVDNIRPTRLHFDVRYLWDSGMPQTVTHVKFVNFGHADFLPEGEVDLNLSDVLERIVSRTPQHITKLAFNDQKGLLPESVHDTLLRIAPVHLTLRFKGRR